MALKQKNPRFKDVGGGQMNTGGAPIFADDFLTIQENARADSLNDYEYLRKKLPQIDYYQGVGNPDAPNFEAGLILSGLEYDNTDPQNPIISEGYILSGGEVCYFAGAQFNTGPTAQGLVYLFKGAESPVSRVFNDGGNKEILTSFVCSSELGSIGAQGPVMPVGTAITATDEVVVISCGTGSETYAESFCSKEAALNINTFGIKLNKNAWTNATGFATGVTLDASIMPFMVSRILPGNFTEIRGAVKIDFSTLTGPTPVLFNLSARSITMGSNLPIFARYTDDSLNRSEPPVVSINILGDVKLDDQGGSFPTSGTGILVFNSIIYGNNTTPADEYQYKENFLNIT